MMSITPISWKQSRKPRHLLVGAVLTGGLFLCALVSLWWPLETATEMNMDLRLAGVSAQHWLGTDVFGRDTATLLLLGARSSIVTGVMSVGVGLLIGALLGLWAAMARAWVQEVIVGVSNFILSFPAILLAIVFAAAFGPGMHGAIAALAVVNIPVFLRLARSSARGVWHRDFVQAARACGHTRWYITRTHVVPHLIPVLVVQATTQFALAILAEAALSYLGLGTQAPQPSWGRMLNEAQTLMFQAPWQAVYPGLAIAISVLGLNLLGDGLRDWLDPRESSVHAAP